MQHVPGTHDLPEDEIHHRVRFWQELVDHAHAALLALLIEDEGEALVLSREAGGVEHDDRVPAAAVALQLGEEGS
jgi:hypothetical protein